MIYTPRYIFNSELEELICTCDNSKKYRVLYSHSSSIENAENGKLIGLSSQVIAICSKCRSIYKFELKYNPIFNEKVEIKNVTKVTNDISEVKEDIISEFKSFEETFSFKSDEFLIKILNERYDNDKKITEFIYMEK
ncbi:hypothetical protein EAI30_06355 [Romboutsia ilealis]|uniref:CpXC domain-containing protein n=1 Tax=Romboutsia faecis TaxID=2764597 RepID=A0ABR7JP59_9FIRM|nr:hypothetical protein [Romboutsia faecis]MBC5996709.1 hypothetical protein [Romboutsia faecis]MRN24235.1 hypothetical protein [Romboutsia ilealis]